MAALKILKTEFKDNSKEWKLVAGKGAGFIKKAGLSLEKLLEAVIAKINV